MLDLGFVKPIRRIVSQLAHRRQNLFFSATMPKEISGLANELLRDPVKVEVTPVATTAERVSQRVIFIEAGKKRTILKELLSDPKMERTLVFTRTKRGADRVAHTLDQAQISSAAIHGNKSQRQRENALEAFRRGEVRVLVATDIAARGIDIDLVSHVVNYELPEVPEAYVHRIGRTARAGASGTAISLCDNEERDLLRAIERTTRQQIPHEDRRNDPTIVAPPRAEGRPEGRQEGRRADGRRPEGRRPEGRRPEGRRGEGHRNEGRRQDARSQERRNGDQRGEQRNDHRNGDARRDDRGARQERSFGDRPARGDDRRHQARDGADAPRHHENRRSESRQGEPRRPHRDGGDRPRRDGGDRREHGAGLSGVGFLKRPSGQRGSDRAGR